jgi:gliding motility-associated-like protein
VSNSFQTINSNNVLDTAGKPTSGRPFIGFGAKPPCSVPFFSLPNDLLVCGTNPVALNVPTNVNNTAIYSYTWIRKTPPTAVTGTNVGSGLTINTLANTNAMYVLIVTNAAGTCSRRDSILVTYGAAAPTFNLGADIIFCGTGPNYNNTTQLKPLPALINPTVGLTFQWTGFTLPPGPSVPITGIPTPTAQTSTPTQAGQYILTVSRGLCKTRDTINLITPVPKFTLPNDTTICNTNPIIINAPSNISFPLPVGYTINWFSHAFATNFPTTPIVGTNSITAPIANTDHFYVLSVSSPSPGACTKKDSIRIRYGAGGINFSLGPDVFFCKTPNIIQLKPIPLITPTAGLNFSWSALDLAANSSVPLNPPQTPNSQTYTPSTNAGRYILKVVSTIGCVTRDTISLFDKSVPSFSILPSKLPNVYPKDTFLCNSTSPFNLNVPLIVSTSNYSYTWIEHPTTTFTPNIITPGVTTYATNPSFPERYYTLKVFNGSCFKSDSTRVFYVNLPANFLGPDLQYCGQPVSNDNFASPLGVQLKPVPLIAPATGYTFAWTGKTIAPPASTNITGIPTAAAQTTTPPKAGEYKLTVTRGTCVFRDSLFLTPLIPNIKLLSKDTSVCNGQASFNIPVPTNVNTSPPFTYTWYNYIVGSYSLGTNISSANNVNVLPTILPNFPGEYFVLTVNNGTCARKDSIKIRFGLPTPINLINDTFYCTTVNTVQLKPIVPLPATPAAPVNVYSWTGKNLTTGLPIPGITTASTQSTLPTLPGKYFLNYTNSIGCKSVDSVVLNNYKVVLTPPNTMNITSVIGNRQNDTILCTATSYAMKGPNLPANVAPYNWTYQWNKIPNYSTILSGVQNYTATGGFGPEQYILYAQNGFCQDSDKINIVFSGLPVVNLGNDDTLCIPFNKTLSGPTNNALNTYTYNWTILPSSLLSNAKDYVITNGGTYVLTATNQYNCFKRDSVKIDARSITPFALANDTGACEPNFIPVIGPIKTLPLPNVYNYSWNTNPQLFSKDLNIGKTGTYVLTVKNGPCVVKDSIKIEILKAPKVILPNDTNICGKNLYQVIVAPDSINNALIYTWSDGTLGPINTIGFDGNYILTASNKYCSVSDDITITSRIKPALNSLGPDKEFCDNENIDVFLNPLTNYFPPSPFTITWLPDGQSTAAISAKLPGQYIIKVTNGLNCGASDTIRITSLKVPKPIIPDSLFICGSGSFTINASCKAKSYLWSNGSKDSIIVVSEKGFYAVEATNGRCKGIASLLVDKLNPFTVGKDFDFCPVNENPIVEIPNLTKIFEWRSLTDAEFENPDSTSRKLAIKKAGVYIASITKGNCTLYDTVDIKTFNEQAVFIPNSFSPNDNNAVNPNYFIKANDVKDFNIKVFTRFGELLFQSSDPNFKWDGRNPKGERLMSGAYLYSVTYKSYCSGDELFNDSGILNIF